MSFVLACMFAKPALADQVWGVTEQNFLISWDTSDPGNLISGSSITGLQVNERILGIDYRPADRMLYAIGSSNTLYQMNTSGAATQIGSVFASSIDGSSFGYDFNPTIDRSRIDTNTNRNYVVNPNDGSISQVTDLFYAMGDANEGWDPNVVHIGYTNSVNGAMSTQLYGIDSGLDILVAQANSAGTLTTIGSLGMDITELGGFDIAASNGVAYGAFQSTTNSNSQFFTVNLSTGAASWVGEIGGGTVITAMTVQSVPEPTSALVGLGGIALLLRRRRAC